jgi:hypothetical protein
MPRHSPEESHRTRDKEESRRRHNQRAVTAKWTGRESNPLRKLHRSAWRACCKLAPGARLKELVGDPEGQHRHHEQRHSPPVATPAQKCAEDDQPDTNDKFHTGKEPGVAIGECSPWVFHEQGSRTSDMLSRCIHHAASCGTRPRRRRTACNYRGPEQLLVAYAPAACMGESCGEKQTLGRQLCLDSWPAGGPEILLKIGRRLTGRWSLASRDRHTCRPGMCVPIALVIAMSAPGPRYWKIIARHARITGLIHGREQAWTASRSNQSCAEGRTG